MLTSCRGWATLWDRDRVWMCGTGARVAAGRRAAVLARRPGAPRRPQVHRRVPRRRARPGRKGPAEFRERFAETKIFVENLSFETDWMALKDHFIDAGYPIASVSYDKNHGRSKGCRIVQFETVDAVAAVEQMTGSMLDGRSINCRPDAGQPAAAATAAIAAAAATAAAATAGAAGAPRRAAAAAARPQRVRRRTRRRVRRRWYGRDDGRGRGAFAANERRKGLDERRKLYDAYGHDYTRHDDDATSLAGDEPRR